MTRNCWCLSLEQKIADWVMVSSCLISRICNFGLLDLDMFQAKKTCHAMYICLSNCNKTLPILFMLCVSSIIHIVKWGLGLCSSVWTDVQGIFYPW